MFALTAAKQGLKALHAATSVNLARAAVPSDNKARKLPSAGRRKSPIVQSLVRTTRPSQNQPQHRHATAICAAAALDAQHKAPGAARRLR